MSQLRRLLTASITLALLATTTSISGVSAATPLMPDLGMAQLRAFSIDKTSTPGKTKLRFTTVIINIGNGPFQAFGHGPKTNGELLVDGMIKDSAGNWSSYATPYHMIFAGDGHQHWHVKDIERYVLRNTAGQNKGTGEKHGFCFYDNEQFDLSLPGAPSSPRYTGCGRNLDTNVTVGLSVGWGDHYPAKIPDQYIDITGLPSGNYTLTATADPGQGFRERCEGNNSTTATLHITSTSVTVVTAGTPSKMCWPHPERPPRNNS